MTDQKVIISSKDMDNSNALENNNLELEEIDVPDERRDATHYRKLTYNTLYKMMDRAATNGESRIRIPYTVEPGMKEYLMKKGFLVLTYTTTYVYSYISW